jgi:hypothetical protein
MSKIDPQQDPAAAPTKPGGGRSLGKATGPRTESGKMRSSRNSIKAGIFSQSTLLDGESRSEYQMLLNGFSETFGSVGELEKLLVEKLVSISWRYERLLVAEGAEIHKKSKFVEFDQPQFQQEEGEEISRSQQSAMSTPRHPVHVGLIWSIQNLRVLENCLELLVELRQGIEANGLVAKRDDELLGKIYGSTFFLFAVISYGGQI